MRLTNARLRQLLTAAENEIALFEDAIAETGGDPELASAFARAVAGRRLLRQWIGARRDEASKPVVDFAAWKSGDGALYALRARERQRAA